jgi:hypothetical protein
MYNSRLFALVAVLVPTALAQNTGVTRDPFRETIAATEGVIAVKWAEFAAIPDSPGGKLAARPMLLLDESSTRRLFVNDMRGPLYSISYDGKSVKLYLDINAEQWGVKVQSNNFERGFQSFAFHPDFNRRGARGFGKLYTITDTSDTSKPADFKPNGGNHTHDSVLLEWTAKDPTAPAYDGAAPRELIRFEQPFVNHNCGHLTFNPLARPNTPEYGLLYVGFADGGSGGDPLNNAQNLGNAFGKIHRIDPLGSNSANKKYGIPASNPFVGKAGVLGEIYAYGARNPQRLFWDRKTGAMYMSDIGQNIVEEISPVTAGGNLGWNTWEASFQYKGREGVSLENQRGDPKVIYPIVEWDHSNPGVLFPSSAAIGGLVYRENRIEQLSNLIIFGDNPSGEIFYVSADNVPKGGQAPIRRILFDDKGEKKTLLQLIKEKNTAQGRQPAARADLRFGEGPNQQIFILNKADGTIRVLVP